MASPSQAAATEQPLFRSKAGCVTCRQRKKRCDFAKPSCETCLRLGFKCEWFPAKMSLPSAIKAGLVKDKAKPIPLELLQTKASPSNLNQIAGSVAVDSNYVYSTGLLSTFDDPSILRASPTSIFEDPIDKQLHQFLVETGHLILNFGLPDLPGLKKFNVVQYGFAAFHSDRLLMKSGLALAAGQLGQSHALMFARAAKYYQDCLRGLFGRINFENGVPSPTSCLTALWLSQYEQSVSRDPEVGLKHFLGFQNLVLLALKSSAVTGLTNTVFESYVFGFLAYSTFRSREALTNKKISYIDDFIMLRNQADRPFGKPIFGVPDELISVAYKLNYLRTKTLHGHLWEAELVSISKALQDWQPSPMLSQPAYRVRYAIAKLYHLACGIYCQKLLDQTVDCYTTPSINAAVQDSVTILSTLQSDEGPPRALYWPCIILGLAVSDHGQLKCFKSRLKEFVDICRFVCHQNMIELLDTAWGEGRESQVYLGLNALFHENLLKTVHF